MFRAGGYHVPPMLIFKGAYHLREYFENDIDGNTLFARSETGFTNDVLSIAWLKHFERFAAPRTKGAYRILIFDGYGSHLSQDFLDFCWQHKIRPYQLPPHSTHLTQPADVGAFQKLKCEFKKELRRHIFLGGNAVTKTDFFAIFQTFSDRTWTTKLCKSAFRKTGLIPYNLVLEKMKDYGGMQDNIQRESDREPSSSPAFATPPPKPWEEYNHPITYTQRKRGSNYVDERIEKGPWPLTPTVKRVKLKVDKYVEAHLHSGQLAKEHLEAVLANQSTIRERNGKPGTVIQKYGEIYGNVARRQIKWDDEQRHKVVNLESKRGNSRPRRKNG